MSVIKIDVKKNIPAMDKQAQEASVAAVAELADDALRIVQSRTPVRSGKLQSSYKKVVSGLTAQIVNPTEYLWMVEKGTRPHVIVANSAKALHFFVGGQEVFAKSVQHPGSKGRFMIRDTEQEIRTKTTQVMNKHLQKVGKP